MVGTNVKFASIAGIGLGEISSNAEIVAPLWPGGPLSEDAIGVILMPHKATVHQVLRCR